jgi:hypothetical protein
MTGSPSLGLEIAWAGDDVFIYAILKTKFASI